MTKLVGINDTGNINKFINERGEFIFISPDGGMPEVEYS